MKVLVAVKRVIDANVKVRVKADGTGVETANVKMAMNPFCEIAVEEAVRMKEAGKATEIVAVSCGGASSSGNHPHRARHGRRPRHPCADRRRAAAAGRRQAAEGRGRQGAAADSCILGKQAIDDDCNQTGQMLAGLLGWPQATFASKLVPNGSDATVTREVDGGLETISLKLPAVITTDLRLNEPRYASLPNIMKAKKKPIEALTPDALGVDVAPRLKTLKVAEPPKRKSGVKVKSVAELVDKLRNEAKVI